MLPTEDLFVYVYVLVDDAIGCGAVSIPPRPGPAPACTGAGLLAIALARHRLGRRGEAGFLAEVARDWAHLLPVGHLAPDHLNKHREPPPDTIVLPYRWAPV